MRRRIAINSFSRAIYLRSLVPLLASTFPIVGALSTVDTKLNATIVAFYGGLVLTKQARSIRLVAVAFVLFLFVHTD